MTDFTEFSTFSYHLTILLAVIFTKAIVSHFVAHEPLKAFQFYCLKLSDKVNKPDNNSSQRTIAGLVGIVVTLLPIAIILWMFEALVEVNWLWQGLLLYVALGAFGLTQASKTITQALTSNQKHLAKQTLKPWVLRETELLSEVGISKASIEMQLLRTLQQSYTVAFVFLLFGPLAAICYRLILEMHYCWNIKLIKHHHFGLYSNQLASLIQWLPVRTFSLLLLLTSLGKNALLFWRLSKPYFFKLNNNFALTLLALNLAVKLGGVAQYDDDQHTKEKLRKISFNDLARQPQANDIINADKKIHGIIYLSLFFMVIIATAIEIIIANT